MNKKLFFLIKDKRIFFIFLLTITFANITTNIFSATYGSKKFLEPQAHLNISGVTNEILCGGIIDNGFTFQDVNTTCSWYSAFSTHGDIDLKGGRLTLFRDFNFSDTTNFVSPCKIDGNFNSLSFAYGQGNLDFPSLNLTPSPFYFKNTVLNLNSRTTIQTDLEVEGQNIITSNNNEIHFTSATPITVLDNSIVSLKNSHYFFDANSTLNISNNSGILRSRNAILEIPEGGSVTLPNGYLDMRGSMELAGTYSFPVLFTDCQTKLNKRVILNDTWTFSRDCALTGADGSLRLTSSGSIVIGSDSTLFIGDLNIKGLKNNQIIFTDNSSSLWIYNSTIELDENITFTTGNVKVAGPTTFSVKDYDFTFDQNATLTVRGTVLWKDPLSENSLGDIKFGSASNLDLIDSGTIRYVITDSSFDSIRDDVRENSNAIINLGGNLAKQNSNAIINLQEDINENSQTILTNNQNILNNSQAIVTCCTLTKENSNAIIDLGGNLAKQNSNAIINLQEDINENSQTIVTNSQNILYNSNTIVNLQELVIKNSNAIVTIDPNLSIQNSNAIVNIYDDVLENSSAIINNAQNIIYNSNAIINTSGAVINALISQNSWAILALTDDVRENSNAILNTSGAIVNALIEQNSWAIVALNDDVIENSYAITNNKNDIAYNSAAIITCCNNANTLIQQNSNAIVNLEEDINENSQAIVTNDNDINYNSQAIITNSQNILYNSQAIVTLDELTGELIIENSNAIINLQEDVAENSSALITCCTNANNLITQNSNAIINLEEDINENSQAIVTNRDDIDSLTTILASALNDITENSNAIVNNNEDIAYNSAAIITCCNNANTLIQQNSNAIINLEEDINENSQAIVTNDNDINYNSQAIVTNSQNILYNSNAIVDLQELVIENSDAIVTLDNDVGTLITENSNAIVNIYNDVLENSNAIINLEEDINENSQAIVTNRDDIDSLTTILASALNDITENSNAIVNNNEDISYNSAAIITCCNNANDLITQNSNAIINNSQAIENVYDFTVENSWAIANIDNEMVIVKLVIENSNAIIQSSNAIVNLDKRVTENSWAIINNSNAIVELDNYIKQNSNFIENNSWAILAIIDDLQEHSNAIVTNDREIIQNSNAIKNNKEDIAYNSAAIITCCNNANTLIQQNSNAIVNLEEDINENSNAIVTNANSINYNSQAIYNNQDEIDNLTTIVLTALDDIEENSSAIITCCALTKENSNAIINVESDLAIQNSNAIVNNSNSIETNKNDIDTLTTIIASALDDITENSNAIVNNSNSIYTNTQNITNNSNAIVTCCALTKENSNAIININELVIENSNAIVSSSISLASLVIENSNAIVNSSWAIANDLIVQNSMAIVHCCTDPLITGSITSNLTVKWSRFIQPYDRIVVAGDVTIEGRGTVLYFATHERPVGPQFIIEEGKTLTLKNINLTGLTSNTFDFRKGSSLIIGENVSWELHENMTLTTGNIVMQNQQTIDGQDIGNLFYVRGMGGKKRLTISPTENVRLPMISLGQNTIALQDIEFTGIEYVSRSISSDGLLIGAIGLAGDAAVNVEQSTNMAFSVFGLGNIFRILKNNITFNGQLDFVGLGEDVLHVDFVLRNPVGSLNASTQLKDGKVPVINFASGFIYLTSFSGIARLIFDDAVARVNNAADAFVVTNNSYLAANKLLVSGDPIWDASDDSTKNRFAVEAQEIEAVKAIGIEYDNVLPEFGIPIIVDPYHPHRSMDTRRLITDEDLMQTLLTGIRPQSALQIEKAKEEGLDPESLLHINID